MSYHGTLNRLADSVKAEVLGMYNAWAAGGLTSEQFVELAAALVARGNARAVSLADLALASALSVDLGVVQPTVGAAARNDVQRLRDGLTVLIAADDATARLGRFATAEVAAAAQQGWTAVMAVRDDVEGWSRQTDADACKLCQDWARGDNFFPKSVTMIHHTGCQCTPKPIVRAADAAE